MLLNILYALTVLVSILTIQTARKKFGFLINHYFLTNIYWIASLTVSIYFNTYLCPVTFEVYLIFLVGLCCFNATIVFSKIRPITVRNNSVRYSLKKRRIIESIVLIALVPLAYKNFLLILSGVDLWALNHEYWYESRNAGSYFVQVYQQNIIEPLATILMATCFFSYYDKSRNVHNNISLVIGFVISILFLLLTGGGRTHIGIFAFFCALSFFASKNGKMRIYFTQIPLSFVVVVSVLMLFLISWASTGRGSDIPVQEVLTSRLAYFAPIFEHYYTSTNVFSDYTMGLSMFETIVAFFLYPLKSAGLIDGFQRAGEISQEFVYIPQVGGLLNAGVSAYFYYMRDFGYLGILLGPVIVANIYNWLYKICMKSPFLLTFYFTGILNTCLATSYPFGRGFIFMILFIFWIDKYMRTQKAVL